MDINAVENAPGGALLSSSEVRTLSHPAAWHTAFVVAWDWALVAAVFALAARVDRWWIYPIAMALMARQQLALAILMHDGAHGRLFQSRWWNDHVSQLFCAGPIFLPHYTYRRSHLKHHQAPLTAGDPDIILIGGYPVTKEKLAKRLLQDLVGISYFKFLKFFLYQAKRHRRRTQSAGRPPSDEILKSSFVRASIVGTNLILFAALAALGHPFLYVLLWTLPSMTILQCYLRVRGLAEHAGYQPGPDQAKNARTVINPWQTFFVAPHNVNYHIEHHLYPSVPYFNLPKLHTMLQKRGALPKANLFDGYGPVLASLVY
ncbi:MAG: fatty acid desaturase family protein [Elusimicrobia bacterium]|nr:fatty acid desaturase family protein [Elusimicrobiota bacterium]